MKERIHAIYKNGVFRPLKQLNLEEGSIVQIKIINVLEDALEYIGKDSTELDADELKQLEKILNQ